jgi:hypothetical protein
MQGMFIKTANFRDMTVAPSAESAGTRFTCFTGTKAYWYKYMNVAPEAELDESAGTRFTCFTGTKAYWYKYMDVVPEAEHDKSVGTRFTCFTGTKVRALLVQILTQKERRLSAFFFWSVELDASGCCTETAAVLKLFFFVSGARRERMLY